MRSTFSICLCHVILLFKYFEGTRHRKAITHTFSNVLLHNCHISTNVSADNNRDNMIYLPDPFWNCSHLYIFYLLLLLLGVIIHVGPQRVLTPQSKEIFVCLRKVSKLLVSVVKIFVSFYQRNEAQFFCYWHGETDSVMPSVEKVAEQGKAMEVSNQTFHERVDK